MRKKNYIIEEETLGILTQPNETDNGKEIPQTIITTAGVFVQSEQSLKICNSKELPKS
jgi:hypothetical protein